jgi:drug/metabolite transporter (DMT)-like permease
MSLWVAVPSAVGAAVAYGASTAVQHSVTHTDGSSVDAIGLLRAVRNPRWLLGTAGDGLGLLLQVIALATGPVVLIQPILGLALPISLPIAQILGGPAPGPREFRACGLIVVGLAAFFAIIGNPGVGDELAARSAILAAVIAAVAGILALVAVGRTVGARKAAIYGTVAGGWFGLVAVFMDASATSWRQHGIAAFAHPAGLSALIALVVLGAASIVLTQVSFQIGTIGASFPASLAADPVVAVVLGAVLLHEDVPFSAGPTAAYCACLAAVLAGAIRLAADPVALP